jgi:hypothetical protein
MKLNNDMPITNSIFLKEPKQILNMIKDYKPTTQRSYIICICSVLRDNTKMKKSYDEYFELLKTFNNYLKVNNEKTETQKKIGFLKKKF